MPPLNLFSSHLFGILVSLFASKVAPCFHVPTVFRFSGHWTRQPARATWIKHLARQASVQNTTVLLHVWFETFCWLHCQLVERYPPQFPSTASFPIDGDHNYEINSAHHYLAPVEPIPFQGGCLQSLERRYLGVHVDVDKVLCSVATSSVHTELPGWGCGLHDFAVQKIPVEGDLCLSVVERSTMFKHSGNRTAIKRRLKAKCCIHPTISPGQVSGSHRQLFGPCLASSAWHSRYLPRWIFENPFALLLLENQNSRSKHLEAECRITSFSWPLP